MTTTKLVNEIIKKFNLSQPYFPIDGYNYRVSILTSVDGGKTFYFAGEGKFFIERSEALSYIKKYIAENKDTFVFCNENYFENKKNFDNDKRKLRGLYYDNRFLV